jgi:large subunit ribosomal protein L25
MEEVTLAADTTRALGTRPSRRLRAQGRVPAVLYGHGIDPVALAVDGRELRNALTGEAGLNALINLEVDGTKHLAMARHLQRHPVRGGVSHVDFVIVRRDEVVGADIPVHLVGEASEVLKEDGIVEQTLFTLTIRALPADIPGAIEVDVSELTIGATIRVGDVKLPAGVETDADPDDAVVVGQPPRVEEVPEVPEGEEVAEGEEGAAAAEGEAPAEGEARAEGGGGGEPAEPGESGGEG